MSVAGRIATGTALLLLLLLALSTYHLRVVGDLTAANRELATEGTRLIVEGLEEIRLLELLDDSVRKFVATGDERYAERAAQVGPTSQKKLLLLSAVADSAEQRALVGDLQETWNRLIPAVAAIARLPEPSDAEARAALLRPSLVQLGELRRGTQRLVDLAHNELIQQVDRLERERRRSERVALWVSVSAMLLGLLTLTFTIGSIQRSLRRLIEATRQVSEENYLHQIEAPRGDEFSRLAVAFNHMVRRLGELDTMKRDLLSEVSHELKTPLANIEESHRVLLDGLTGPLNADQRRLLNLALGSCHRLSRLISNLLERARLAAGAVELQMEEIELGSLVNGVVEEFATMTAARGVLLASEIQVPGQTVRCDRERIAQVFRNLIDNALKSSARGARIVLRSERLSAVPADLPERWRASCSANAPFVLAEVCDEGVGVAPDDREKIFRRFHRVEQRKFGTPGVGLGLAICREVVQAHRGAIWVVANRPVGSRFRLLLPEAAAAEETSPAAAPGPMEATG